MQAFVPGRTPSVVDAAADLLGAVAGAVAAEAWLAGALARSSAAARVPGARRLPGRAGRARGAAVRAVAVVAAFLGPRREAR